MRGDFYLHHDGDIIKFIYIHDGKHSNMRHTLLMSYLLRKTWHKAFSNNNTINCIGFTIKAPLVELDDAEITDSVAVPSTI